MHWKGIRRFLKTRSLVWVVGLSGRLINFNLVELKQMAVLIHGNIRLNASFDPQFLN
jgi:hypothetical protein